MTFGKNIHLVHVMECMFLHFDSRNLIAYGAAMNQAINAFNSNIYADI